MQMRVSVLININKVNTAPPVQSCNPTYCSEQPRHPRSTIIIISPIHNVDSRSRSTAVMYAEVVLQPSPSSIA